MNIQKFEERERQLKRSRKERGGGGGNGCIHVIPRRERNNNNLAVIFIIVCNLVPNFTNTQANWDLLDPQIMIRMHSTCITNALLDVLFCCIFFPPPPFLSMRHFSFPSHRYFIIHRVFIMRQTVKCVYKLTCTVSLN